MDCETPASRSRARQVRTMGGSMTVRWTLPKREPPRVTRRLSDIKRRVSRKFAKMGSSLRSSDEHGGVERHLFPCGKGGGIRVAAQDRWAFRQSVLRPQSCGPAVVSPELSGGVMASRLPGRRGWRPVSLAPRLRPNGWMSRCQSPPWPALRLAFQSRLARSRRQQR
jgi:hypothetical protein